MSSGETEMYVISVEETSLDTHTHTLAHSLTHLHTHTHTRSLTHSLTHTHTHTLTHSLTYTHVHTQTQDYKAQFVMFVFAYLENMPLRVHLGHLGSYVCVHIRHTHTYTPLLTGKSALAARITKTMYYGHIRDDSYKIKNSGVIWPCYFMHVYIIILGFFKTLVYKNKHVQLYTGMFLCFVCMLCTSLTCSVLCLCIFM